MKVLCFWLIVSVFFFQHSRTVRAVGQLEEVFFVFLVLWAESFVFCFFFGCGRLLGWAGLPHRIIKYTYKYIFENCWLVGCFFFYVFLLKTLNSFSCFSGSFRFLAFYIMACRRRQVSSGA